MTKAALRRQERERQAREEEAARNAPEAASPSQQVGDRDAITEHPTSPIPHMDPPPPYDAPHLPRTDSNQSTNSQTRNSRSRKSNNPDGGCLNAGPGKTSGCMNFNTGTKGDDFQVDGCMNFDSRNGCMNFESDQGCMNYQSSDGCMNYRSGGGCMNYESRKSFAPF